VPEVGEHIERWFDKRTIKWTISEIVQSRGGSAVFSVRVYETDEGRTEAG
jgi:hypothetical protein